jgi:hypothetical protein
MYGGNQRPTTPVSQPVVAPLQTRSPVSPIRNPPKTPVNQTTGVNEKDLVELEGEKRRMDDIHPLHRPLHEMPSPK